MIIPPFPRLIPPSPHSEAGSERKQKRVSVLITDVSLNSLLAQLSPASEGECARAFAYACAFTWRMHVRLRGVCVCAFVSG